MGALTKTQFMMRLMWSCTIRVAGWEPEVADAICTLRLFSTLTLVDGAIHVTPTMWFDTPSLDPLRGWLIGSILARHVETPTKDPTRLLNRVIRVVGNPWEIADAVQDAPTLCSFKVLETKSYSTSTEALVEEIRHLYAIITQAVMVANSSGDLDKLSPLLQSSGNWAISPNVGYTSVQVLHDVHSYRSSLGDPATMLSVLADVKEVRCSWA